MPQHLRFATKAAQICFQSKVPAYMLSASFMSHDSEKKKNVCHELLYF